MVDFGYDISDFTDIDPTFGSLEDFSNLVHAAHDLGTKFKKVQAKKLVKSNKSKIFL